jgi:O-antigen/teichoic acid export membrane protein
MADELYGERHVSCVDGASHSTAGFNLSGADEEGRNQAGVDNRTMASQSKPPAPEHTRFLRNASFNAVGQAVVLVVGLASLPVLVRGLGPQRFALLSLALLVLGNTTLLDIGLGRATTKFLAEARSRGAGANAAATFWTSLALHGALGLGGGGLVLIATPGLVNNVLHTAPELRSDARLAFIIVAAAIPLVLVGSCLRGALEALQRFDLASAVKVPASALLYVAPAVLIAAGHGLIAIMIVTWFNRAAVVVAYGLVLGKIWPALRRVGWHRPVVRELLSFGGWVWATNVSGAVLGYADRFAIGAMVSLTALGYYSAPSDGVTRAYLVPAGVVVALFPAFSGLARQNKNDLVHLFGLGVKVLVFVLLPSTAILISYAPAILRIWLGADYEAHALVVFDILLLGSLISSLGWVPSAFLQACGRPDLPAKVLLYEMPVYALLLWASTSAYGITGVAAAWAVRATAEAVAFFWLAKRSERSVLTNLRRLVTFRSMGHVALLLVPVLARAAVLRQALLMSALMLGLGVVAFVGLSWRHFFDVSEREALAGFLVFRSG